MTMERRKAHRIMPGNAKNPLSGVDVTAPGLSIDKAVGSC
jgi:hypothetical protein